MNLSKDQVTNSLKTFVTRRDDLLHEDTTVFGHHLQRFVEFCQKDSLVQSVLGPLQQNITPDASTWWNEAKTRSGYQLPTLSFPENQDEELILRYEVLILVATNPRQVSDFGFAFGKRKGSEGVELFRTLIIRPFMVELGDRLSQAANLASPEARALQAVPLDRIPNKNEIRVFLSHKSVNKPLVYRYYNTLKALGFNPWLDDPDLTAGANLEREILKGFEESCAAVFFITEDFKDENYLATEIDYAMAQKRKKDNKFAIITLRYSNAAPIPELLTRYVYKVVSNDLEGFYELLRALPIELGPVRWKAEAVSTA